jgi:membrane protein implicated in regulation of membrane protease activity
VSLNWLLIIAGAVLILLEVLLGAFSGFDFLLVGSAVLLGGLLGLVTHSPMLGVATGGVLALLYVFLGRKHIRSRLKQRELPSNTDALLGRTVLVTHSIGADHAGRIRFEGEEWRALLARPSSDQIESGRNVRIERIDGVTVYVQPVEGQTGGLS